MHVNLKNLKGTISGEKKDFLEKGGDYFKTKYTVYTPGEVLDLKSLFFKVPGK